jgi:uncharacterized protein YutE (UPF0331/DUF86 family)
MYYVNIEQIEQRLAVISVLIEACGEIQQQGAAAGAKASDSLLLPLIARLAQERTLHLAIELVTDVGSLLIDGFLLRDASSYEDIIEILRVEGVFPDEQVVQLQELVKLRRPLVQEYMTWDAQGLHPLIQQLPGLLPQFELGVRRFIAKELGHI